VLGASTSFINEIIDGSGTTLVSGALPMLAVNGSATIGGVRLTSSTFANYVLSVNAGGSLKMASSTIDNAGVIVSQGTGTFTNVVVTNGIVECTNGMATVRSSTFDRSAFKPSTCRFEISSSKFNQRGDSGNNIFGDGRFTIENNLFTDNVSGSQISIFGADPGSTIRFNTFVNTAPGNTGTAILCPDGLDVTSNIFAVNSTKPLLPCAARYSLFDAAGASSAVAGVSNVVGEGAVFFKNAAIGDYHLNVGSPAIDKGEPNFVTTDLEGHPRGALPDIGAYEAP
jgi:hypothetical protein